MSDIFFLDGSLNAMRKSVIAILLLLLPFFSAAQKFSFAAEGLINLSSAHTPFYYSEDVRYKPSFGMGLGASMHYNFTEKNFIRIPVLAEMRAAHNKLTVYDTSG